LVAKWFEFNSQVTSLAGESDPFGQRIIPSSEVVRQTYPGPVHSVGIRSQLAVGMQTRPGMPPPQFAVQHRPMGAYSEVPRHEVIWMCYVDVNLTDDN